MFQSSRTASGRPRLQISSACSPSSASTIWKSRPSRMRRATFRMTLESSTTRHVFILASTLSGDADRASRFLRRELVGGDFEHAVDVEYDHQLAVEAVHAIGHFRHPRIQVDRIDLAA